MSAPQANGHDKQAEATFAEACDLAGGTMSTGAVILQEQVALLQAAAMRQSERATIEALAQDAMRRLQGWRP